MLKRGLPRCTPVDLLGLGSSRCMFRSTKEKHSSAASAEQGRNREGPQNKWLRQLLRLSPQIPSGGQRATSSGLLAAILSVSSWPRLCWGKTREPDVARAQLPPPSPHHGAGLLAALRPIKTQGSWKGKFASFRRPATRRFGRGTDRLLYRGRLPPADNQGARAFIDGGRGYMQRQQSRL